MNSSIAFKKKMSFISVIYAFLVVMMGTTIPTPLYPIYSAVYDLSPLLITIIYAVYAVGVISGLLIFGDLSDRVGRRYILIPGVILSIFSALLFLVSNNLFLLFLGRVVSGFSAGLFMTTATITLINLAPENKKNEASIIASLINMLGLGLGPLLSGVFAEYLPYSIRLIFVVDFLMLIPAIIGILVMVEPVLNKRDFKINIQKLSVPLEMRYIFIFAIIPVFSGFSMLGLFTSISPNFLSDILGINNKMIMGSLVFLIFFSATIGQLLFKSVSDFKILIMGSFTLVLGGIFVCLSLIFYSLLLLVIGAIVSGIGQAFSFRGGLSLINSEAPKDKHSEITSTFFTIAYIGLSIPVIGLGLLGKWLGIQMAGIIFSVIIIFLSFVALLFLVIKRSK